MFCGECGAKNNKDAVFCEECGAKLREVKEEPVKEKKTGRKKNLKKLNKKNKIIIAVVAILVVGLFIGYKVLEQKASPKTLVEKYLTAINQQDYNTLYNLIKSDNASPFMSKDAYVEAMKKEITEKNMLGSITIGNVVYENAGLNAKVTFNSSELSDNLTPSTDSLSIKLTKAPGKQYLFFDNWQIDDETILTFDTVKDYYLGVPKDTKITYGNVVVGNKYIDDNKKTSKENFIYYKLPEVLKTTTKVTFELPDGLKIEKDIVPSSYSSSYQLSITKSDFSEKQQETLTNQAEKDYKTIINAVIEGKEFKEIKNNFSKKLSLDDLEEEYNDSLEDIEDSSYKISNYNIKSTRLYSIYLGDDYLYGVRVYISYTYDVQRKSDSSSTPSDRTRSGYYTLYYTYEDGYKLVDVSGLHSF